VNIFWIQPANSIKIDIIEFASFKILHPFYYNTFLRYVN